MYGDRVKVRWRYFSLEQVNNKNGPDWKIWEQPDDYPTRGLPALRAIEAARLQGDTAYERMLYGLLEGRHERRKDFTDPGDVEEIARTAGLDVARFKRDVANRALMDRIAQDHTKGVREYGVFGTPTFVFEDGKAFFMRIKAPETAQEAARIWDGLYAMFVATGAIDEVKRPRKPKD